MCGTIRATSVIDDDSGATVGHLQLEVIALANGCLMFATGELDSASRDGLVAALTVGGDRHMFLNLSAVTFMDCGGYMGLVESRLRLESGGQSLTVLGFTGQPKRFLATIEQLQLQSHQQC